MQQARVEEGLVFARAYVRPHQLRVGGQDPGALLVQVHPGHGRHIVDVIVIPGMHNIREMSGKP